MEPRAHLATYRVQITPRFRFDDVASILRYLEALGITDLYASPILKARRGSRHGYDLVDPTQINPDLGGQAGFLRLSEALQARRMNLLLDIVPNHMAASPENPWWRAVLAGGPKTDAARVFDIDWSRSPKGRVLLPVLREPRKALLDARAFRLVAAAGDLWLEVDRLRFPMSPRSVAFLRRWAARRRGARGAPPGLRELASRANAESGTTEGRRLFAGLLARQAYVLSEWRAGSRRVNYRRFFALNDLIGVRVEDPWVFEQTHRVVLDLAARGYVNGLRVDHIDGLADPGAYLRRLQDRLRGRRASLWTVVEKILAAQEPLPEDWPVDGTTGYDFLADSGALFLDPEGYDHLVTDYRRWTRTREDLADVARAAEREVLADLFSADLGKIMDLLPRVKGVDERADRHALRTALSELTVCLPVYRTYLSDGRVSDRDRQALGEGFRLARGRFALGSPERRALEILHSVLLGASRNRDDPARREFVRRWQQVSGAVMAKGVEDTAFYRFNPLVSMNVVGGDPRDRALRFGTEAFHRAMSVRARFWPRTMNATSTHDTKRGEDVRMRLHALTDMPDEWDLRVRRWHRMNRSHESLVGGHRVPDRGEELFLYQVLLGSWPLDPSERSTFAARIRDYVVKASREAKIHTRWRRPSQAYEDAMVRFADGCTSADPEGLFARDFLPFQRRIAFLGALRSLALLTVKIAAPGIPDFYQGTELWDLSLVDPDNRRRVDFPRREALLHSLPLPPTQAGASALLSQWRDGRVKLHAMRAGLALRRQAASVFLRGAYVPLRIQGSDRVLAFARRSGGAWVLAAAVLSHPRLYPVPSRLAYRPFTGPARILLPAHAPGVWSHVYADGDVQASEAGGPRGLLLRDVFRTWPAALLVSGRANNPKSSRA